MTWFAFHGYDDVNVAGAQEKELVGAGFHGYATQAEADAHPNSVNFFQKLLVNLIEADYKKAKVEGATPGGPNNIDTSSGIEGAVLNIAENVTGTAGFFGVVSAFLVSLTDGRTWASLGWLALGVALIFIGARMWMGKPLTPSVIPIPV